MKDGRDESPEERMDRNFNDLLQELRVVQTGTQILAGFLLTLPFQARFDDVTDYEKGLYLTALALSALTTLLLVAPVSLHRRLFRRHRKDEVVQVSHVLARLGVASLALTTAAALTLIVTVVVDVAAGLFTAAGVLLAFLLAWWVMPAAIARRLSL